MSPLESSRNSDQGSENIRAIRGRPAIPRGLALAAADALFAETNAGETVSMDAIAAAAGVGKGTLFRAFGSRDGLLDALLDAKFSALRDAVQVGAGPLGPNAPPRERIAAFLDAVLDFKLENRHLMRAREVASAGSLQTERYSWMLGLLQGLIADVAPTMTANDPGYAAHALLATLRIDLVEELLATGRTPHDVRRALAALVSAMLDSHHPDRD